ncbi:MAG: hypothetical protein ACYDHM_15610, partial [Acidiferrobacterales bacterium]
VDQRSVFLNDLVVQTAKIVHYKFSREVSTVPDRGSSRTLGGAGPDDSDSDFAILPLAVVDVTGTMIPSSPTAQVLCLVGMIR